MEFRVLAHEQLRRGQAVVRQGQPVENFQIFVFKPLAARAAANGDEHTFHGYTLSPNVSFSTPSAVCGVFALAQRPSSTSRKWRISRT